MICYSVSSAYIIFDAVDRMKFDRIQSILAACNSKKWLRRDRPVLFGGGVTVCVVVYVSEWLCMCEGDRFE